MDSLSDKKVSIVLPVYNGEKYISQAIDSVLGQTWQNWELIIVNDCSSDSTMTICEDYAARDSRIRIISNPQNLKLPATLNAGFDAASGDYYTWISHDNMFKPEAIETLVSALDQNPDAAMVYSNFTNIDADGNIIKDTELKEPEHLVTGNVFGFCFMYTAEIAEKVGKYDTNLFLAEDYDYWMRVYRYGRITHIPKSLYLGRRHAESLTKTKKAAINEQTYKALEKNFLPLYADAKKHDLVYPFFDHMLKRNKARKNEIKKMLVLVDPGYEEYLKASEPAKPAPKKKKLPIHKRLVRKARSIMKKL